MSNPGDAKPSDSSRSDYRYWQQVSTRWVDNDAYGHINNAVYFTYIDSVVNQFLIEHQLLDIQNSEAIGLVCAVAMPVFPVAVISWSGGLRPAGKASGQQQRQLRGRHVCAGRRGCRSCRRVHPCVCRPGSAQAPADARAGSIGAIDAYLNTLTAHYPCTERI